MQYRVDLSIAEFFSAGLEGGVGSFLLGDCSSADIEGCTDSLALNYNENANVDNDSCQYPLLDCNGSDVTNITSWIGDGYCDDGVYSYLGNPVYFNCEEFNWDEGDCPDPNAEILGCTDSMDREHRVCYYN